MKKELFFSVDVETDGPIPGPHSMLSFATVVYSTNGYILGTHSVNLETLPGASADLGTAEWWAKQPEAWAACRTNLVEPEKAMKDYVSWVKTFDGKPVFVAYPAGFDFLFCYWYLMKFAGESPFGFSALDIKTYASALLKCQYRDATKRNFPKRWFGVTKHNHVALSDAKEQGDMFLSMYEERMREP